MPTIQKLRRSLVKAVEIVRRGVLPIGVHAHVLRLRRLEDNNSGLDKELVKLHHVDVHAHANVQQFMVFILKESRLFYFLLRQGDYMIVFEFNKFSGNFRLHQFLLCSLVDTKERTCIPNKANAMDWAELPKVSF